MTGLAEALPNEQKRVRALAAEMRNELCGDYADRLLAILDTDTDSDMRRDAERWKYLVRENNKGCHGAFRIVWFEYGVDGFATTDGVSIDGKDDKAIVRIIDAAMEEK